jgi:hypothetical protein
VTLPDPDGFMGLFNDGYSSVAAAVCTLGKHPRPPYYLKPTAKGQRVQEQPEQYGRVKVIEVEAACLRSANTRELNREFAAHHRRDAIAHVPASLRVQSARGGPERIRL